LTTSLTGCASADEEPDAGPSAVETPSAGTPAGDAPPADAAAAEARARELPARADDATQVLVDRFWLSGAGDFAEAWPSTGRSTGYWTYAQALDAVLDAAERTGAPRWRDLARTIVDAQEPRGWLKDYFDDEAWMAVALLRAHEVTGEQAYLWRAAWLVDDIATNASDASCCGTEPGGLWWDRAHTQKATASNAVPAIAAARLFQRTGERRFLDFARGTYAFWREHMVTPDVPGRGPIVGREKVWWGFSRRGDDRRRRGAARRDRRAGYSPTRASSPRCVLERETGRPR
jgi:uncharacterized protein YyaL (SSP411 family)